jgi:flagellar biosynthesis protein FlhB
MEERGDSEEDKTEDPTDEKRKQFREEGNVANPKELMAAFALISLTATLAFMGQQLFLSTQLSFKTTFQEISRHPASVNDLLGILARIVNPIANQVIVIFFILLALPTLVGLVMTRFNLTFKKMEFDLSKINPVQGLGRVFGTQGWIELGKGILKIVVLGGVCYMIIKPSIFNSEKTHFQDSVAYFKDISKTVFDLLVAICVTTFGLGVFDYGVSWFQIENKLKMSKQELKDAHKKQEGDPQVKTQRKRLARDILTNKTLQKVKEATFVVTNPTHYSVAIRYVKGMAAPVIVAKGQDFLALRIREIAKEQDIILVENRALARTLYKTVKIGQEVPSSLYNSVIEVMRYIYQIKGKNYFQKFETPA